MGHTAHSCTDPDVLVSNPHAKVVRTTIGVNAVMVGHES